MAKADVIAQALFALEEAVDQQRMLLNLLADVAGDQVPDWVGVMSKSLETVRGPMDALGDALRRDALPLLGDFDRVARNGGMGAVAPMMAKVVDGQLINSRK